MRRSINFLVSSDPENGAIQISADGSQFTVQLENVFEIPPQAREASLEVMNATVWWNVPNISAALGNNKFYFEYATNPYVVTIPDGLYSVVDLNSTLNREVGNATGVFDMFTLTGDGPTQKILLFINYTTVQIDFTPIDTFRDLLGFNSQLIPDPNPTTGLFNVLGDNVAAFNSIEYFLLHSDLVRRGLQINHVYDNVIARVPINTTPGSQIIYEPYNPDQLDILDEAGQRWHHMRFWLTDNLRRSVDTRGETWSVNIRISYTV